MHKRVDSQALALLTQLVATASPYQESSDSSGQAFVPPPQHLSLAATLIVHPSLTGKKASAERIQASNTAVKLLRFINRYVGPVNAELGSAFAFLSLRDRRGHGSGRRRMEVEDTSEDGAPVEHINSELANVNSLWTRAEDFWHAVGWAFNCSVTQQRRWARWKIWLNLMLEVLEDDWLERGLIDERAQDDEGTGSTDSNTIVTSRAESLIIKYLSHTDGAHGGFRRVIRAIFADGSTRSEQEFRPVFEDEVKEHRDEAAAKPKKPRKNPLAQRVNVNEGFYADYCDESSDDDDDDDDEHVQGKEDHGESPTGDPAMASDAPRPTRTSVHHEEMVKSGWSGEVPNGSEALGGIQSIAIRLRLLAIVGATIPLCACVASTPSQ